MNFYFSFLTLYIHFFKTPFSRSKKKKINFRLRNLKKIPPSLARQYKPSWCKNWKHYSWEFSDFLRTASQSFPAGGGIITWNFILHCRQFFPWIIDGPNRITYKLDLEKRRKGFRLLDSRELAFSPINDAICHEGSDSVKHSRFSSHTAYTSLQLLLLFGSSIRSWRECSFPLCFIFILPMTWTLSRREYKASSQSTVS